MIPVIGEHDLKLTGKAMRSPPRNQTRSGGKKKSQKMDFNRLFPAFSSVNVDKAMLHVAFEWYVCVHVHACLCVCAC